MAVLDVPVGQHRRGPQRLVRDLAAVVRLVAVAQAAQDLDGVVDRRLVDADLLETPLECGVALQVLAILVERGGADRLQLAARERRFQDRSGVDRTFGGAGANEVMELVDEQDDVAALGDLLHHLLEALLELAAVLGTGDQRREVERVDLLAHQDGVVLRAAREDLHHALDLGLAADDRVELRLCGELRQVAAELVEELGALRLLTGGAAWAALLAPAGAGKHADDLVANLLGVGVEVEQDPCRDSFVLADETEQDVLGADVVVAERKRLTKRQLQDLLRARSERDLAGRDLVALADNPCDLCTDFLDRDVERLEDTGSEPLLLAQQAEQDVLGADVVVFQRARLVLSQNDYLAGSLGETFEHVFPLSASGTLRLSVRPL